MKTMKRDVGLLLYLQRYHDVMMGVVFKSLVYDMVSVPMFMAMKRW